MKYLLLHGFTGSPASLARLNPPEGSVAPAVSGHDDAPLSQSYWDEVDRLASLGADCPGLFGYSLGGRLALGILARHPRRFAHAIIVSAHPGLASEQERQARRLADQRHVQELRQHGMAAFVARWEAEPMWHTQRKLPPELLELQRRERLRQDPERLAHSLEHQGLGTMPDLRPWLGAITCTVTVLVGAEDQKFTALGRELASLLPRSDLQVAEGAGHNLVLERSELCSARFSKHRPPEAPGATPSCRNP